MQSINIFLVIAGIILFMYVLIVFILFLPSFGFGIVPVLVIGAFAGFAILIAIFYNNYDPDNDFTSGDSVYLIGMTVIVIVAFVIIMFIMWFLYTQYTKPIDPKKEGLDFKVHLEDRDLENQVVTPFTMNDM